MYLKPSLTQRSPVLFFLFFKTTLAEICTDSEASRSSHSTNKTNTQLWARRAVSPLSPPPCYNWTLQRAEGKKERKEGGKEGGKLGKENKKVSYFSKLLRLHRDDSNMPNDAWSTSRSFFFFFFKDPVVNIGGLRRINASSNSRFQMRRDIWGGNGGGGRALWRWTNVCRRKNTCWRLRCTAFPSSWYLMCGFWRLIRAREKITSSTTTTTEKKKKNKKQTSLHDRDNGKKKPTEKKSITYFSVLILFVFFLFFISFFFFVPDGRDDEEPSLTINDGMHPVTELRVQTPTRPCRGGQTDRWGFAALQTDLWVCRQTRWIFFLSCSPGQDGVLWWTSARRSMKYWSLFLCGFSSPALAPALFRVSFVL